MPVLGVRLNRHALTGLRQRSGLSQTALGELAGCSSAHLCDIEAGRRNPSPALARRIALALKVPLAAILSNPDDANGDAAA
jgi:transcriptional regulator with XRE-family HTH domain